MYGLLTNMHMLHQQCGKRTSVHKNTETEVFSSDDTDIIYKNLEDLFLIQRTLFDSTLYMYLNILIFQNNMLNK